MNDTHPTVERLAELQQFVADFSQVTRVPMFANTGRLEKLGATDRFALNYLPPASK